jgi:membrane protease YdiL (CAAX protease family)
VQVQYALHLLPFLGFTLILGLLFGYLMQRPGSLLGPVLLHAGSDIPIFLAYLSYVSS